MPRYIEMLSSDHIVDRGYPIWDEITEPLENLLDYLSLYEQMIYLLPEDELEHCIATYIILENELIERGWETE